MPTQVTVEIRDMRSPGPHNTSWSVDWPDGVRVPCVGEMVQIRDEDQVWVKEVQWWVDDPEHDQMGLGRVVVQLVVS